MFVEADDLMAGAVPSCIFPGKRILMRYLHRLGGGRGRIKRCLIINTGRSLGKGENPEMPFHGNSVSCV